MEYFDVIISLLALIVLEIVLGIDNLVFLTLLTDKLPPAERKQARRWGLTFAWITRLILLFAAVWLSKVTQPLFSILSYSFSARDIFLLIGGIFLIYKATQEIHQEVEDPEDIQVKADIKKMSLMSIIIQIGLMDIIFSLDSVLTAIGLTDRFFVMAIAITIAIGVMLYASETVSYFIDKHPSLKMLALGFLILIGMVLVADGCSFHIPRGYIYFAMGFSLGIEFLNILKSRRRKK